MRDLRKLYLNLIFDINIMKLQNIISENRIQLNNEKLKFEEMFQCLDWLQNRIDTSRELEWSKEIRTYDRGENLRILILSKKRVAHYP